MRDELTNRTKQTVLLLVTVGLLILVFLALPFAVNAAEVDTVSLKKLEVISAGDVRPAMYFEPDYFGSGATQYPQDGSSYVPGGAAGGGLVGRGPHGGYDTTSSKCGVCHSVHAAQSTIGASIPVNNHLLRSGSTGCEYCHLQGSVVGGAAGKSGKIVYTGGLSADSILDTGATGVDRSGHAITGQPVNVPASTLSDFTLTCASCHAVHGATASTWMPQDFWGSGGERGDGKSTDELGYKLLRSNPSGVTGGTVPTQASATISTPATDTAAVNQYTLGIWCTNCHNEAYQTQGALASEVTTFTPTGDNIHKAVADKYLSTDATTTGPHSSVLTGVYSGAGQCYTCHRGGGLAPNPEANTLVGNSATTALQGLGYYQTSTLGSAADRQAELEHNQTCARCHFGTADYALLAPGSDWPHSSSNDVALLGNWTRTVADDAGQNPATPAPSDPSEPANYVCKRCHLKTKTTSEVLTISYHAPAHTYNFTELLDTIGSLDNNYSPGY